MKETPDFLGREFLLWLWFRSETGGGEFDVPPHGRVGIAFDRFLELEHPEHGSRITVRGDLPTRLPEAVAGLRAQRLPARARLVVAFGDDSAEATVDAATLDLGSVKAVATATADAAQGHAEREDARAAFLMALPAILEALYRRFVEERSAPEFRRGLLPRMREWVQQRARGPAAPAARAAASS